MKMNEPMNTRSEIVTVTLNPAIDETVFLDELHAGAVNRVKRHHRQPAGKGVNVSSMLSGFGISSTASGFLGRENTLLFDKLFASGRIRDGFLRIDGETRTGIKIVAESTRETTDLNFTGLAPTTADLDALMAKLRSWVKPGTWFVIGGRLPDSVSLGFFKTMLETLKQGGARVAVDTSGEALRVAIGCGVDLIKPNHHELEEILGHELPDLASRAAAAVKLQRDGVSHVILSLGGDGALFVTADAALIAASPPVAVVSTVGAGDSLLAGYLAGLVTDRPAEECARLATVFAWSALEDVNRQAPAKEIAEQRMLQIRVHPVQQ